MYNNYIFDLYGTLLDIYTDENDDILWEKMVKHYASHNAIYSKNEIKNDFVFLCKYFENSLKEKQNYEHVEININDVFLKLYTNKNVSVGEDELLKTVLFFRKSSTRYIRIYDGVIELLDTLKSKGKKIFLLSNAQYDFTYPELKLFGLEKYFDGLLISSIEQVKKPDVNFISKLIEKYNLKVEESIMIGNDKTCDILSAKKVNMDSLYVLSSLSPEIDRQLNIKSTYSVDVKDFNLIKKMIIK